MDLRKNKIIVIIVTFNGIRWIGKCIGSLKSSTVKVLPIIIDNNSTDNTVKYIKTNHPEILIIQNFKNLGFGRANNLGIKKALDLGATHVLLLNQDAYIQNDLLNKLLAYDDNNSLLSPVHLNGNGTDLDYNFKHYTLVSYYLNVDNPADKTQTIDVKFVNAACWLLPIKIINEIGGFNPLFTHYGEDNNYIQRLEYHKFSLKVIKNTFVYHDREKYGNQQIFSYRLRKRIILLIMTNINLKKSEVAKNIMLEIVKVPYFLLQFKFRSFRSQFQVLFFAVTNIKMIRTSRKLEKIKGRSWL